MEPQQEPELPSPDEDQENNENNRNRSRSPSPLPQGSGAGPRRDEIRGTRQWRRLAKNSRPASSTPGITEDVFQTEASDQIASHFEPLSPSPADPQSTQQELFVQLQQLQSQIAAMRSTPAVLSPVFSTSLPHRPSTITVQQSPRSTRRGDAVDSDSEPLTSGRP